jgi:prepilin-type N-terminal cleavage/methylation domain-containing protein
MYKQLKKEQGFTIIEVMIVLAIAGLILLIVFLAVPALQRNARNTSLKNDASAVAAAVTEYESNNSGAVPTTVNEVANSGVVTLGPSNTTTAKVQPSTTVSLAAAATPAVAAAPALNTIKILTGQDCTPTTNSRAVAVYYAIEGSGSALEPTPGCIQS